jgi:eukaryotic-like serine/threonine-protein kinase
MTLATGSHLGSFEVLSPLGSGGMGEVYRARDPRLEREVALKILPEKLAADPDRVARFEREARLLASLNHPHIGAVHGFEQADGRHFLVLELVPGETLADRLVRGAIELRQALTLCQQVADALEEAHAKGVIHRDLKPANIKITPEGRVKVLDFGLAKALGDGDSGPRREDSPTMTRHALSDGLIIGTAGYMSPEQARGLAVDKRADIWAFGCVLYESLTGRRLFGGPSSSDSLAAVLTQEPDWTALPPKTPPLIRSLLRRCLQKEKVSRLHDIGDARLEIEEALREETSDIASAAGVSAPPSPRRLLTHTFAFLLGAIVGASVIFLGVRPKAVMGTAARLNINLPPESRLRGNIQGSEPLALSADAGRLAFVGQRPGGHTQIFVRRMDRLTPEPIPGTEEAWLPFLSPDGEWLGFASEGKLKKVALAGGQPVVICDAPDPRGASWGSDGTILLTPNNAGGLYRVSAAGGVPEAVTHSDRAKNEDGHRWPRLLPGGEAALFSVMPPSGRESQRTIESLNLSTGQWKTLVRGASYPVYADGFLFFGRSGQVFAAPFDVNQLELRGEAQPVLDDVRMDPKNTGLVYFDVSPAGAAVYVPGFPRARERTLVFMDRQGRATPVTSAKRAFRTPAVSPNGRQIALVIEGLDDTLWVLDLSSDTLNRLTFDGDVDIPGWSPDGRSLVYTAEADGPRSVYGIAADGTGKPELLFTRPEWWINNFDARPDGSGMMVAGQDMRGHDLYFVRKGSQEAEPFLATPSDERGPVFSPSGAFVAYLSNESGRMEVYVRPFPGPGPKRQVSTNGAFFAQWSRDGREIFYWEPGAQVGRLMRAPFEPGTEPRIGKPQALFEVPLAMVDNFAVMPDGQRFVMVKPEAEEENPLQIVVIPGFVDEMKARLSGKR